MRTPVRASPLRPVDAGGCYDPVSGEVVVREGGAQPAYGDKTGVFGYSRVAGTAADTAPATRPRQAGGFDARGFAEVGVVAIEVDGSLLDHTSLSLVFWVWDEAAGWLKVSTVALALRTEAVVKTRYRWVYVQVAEASGGAADGDVRLVLAGVGSEFKSARARG
ncbi:MAG: hypothetical protein EKK55_18315 [Rhodocyclaceae bacterium]|nr:MAG: hypothetical protein EKK55_18315 [Rhodocyclaceae bacterium]